HIVRESFQVDTIVKSVAPAVVILLAACAHPAQHQSPTVAPARATAARTSHAPAGARPTVATVANDPFHRIDRMDWPGPNEYRLADGSPGPAYWQQRADYDIRATLDTAAKTLAGQVRIHYTNNSPDTLHFVWLQLDQNLYKPGSAGEALYPPDSRFGVRGFQGGYTIDHL